MKDTLITQFLKSVDKSESDTQFERLRKMLELESRCRRLEKEKALLQKELVELQKKVNNKSKITNSTKPEANERRGSRSCPGHAQGQAEMKSKGKEQQKPKKQQQQQQVPNVQRQPNRPEAAGLAGKKDKLEGYTAVYKPGTTILADDSLLKNLKGWMMARDGKIQINSFPGATTQDMHHYLKPLLTRKPDHVTLHCSTNNLMNNLMLRMLQIKESNLEEM